MKTNLLFLFVAVLLFAELGLYAFPQIVFMIYAVLVGGGLILLGYTDRLDSDAGIIISLMILPMIRLVELFLTFSFFWRTLIVYSALLFLVLIYIFRFNVRPGFRRENTSLLQLMQLIIYTFRYDVKIGFKKENIKWLPVALLLGLNLGIAGSYILGLEKHPELLYLLPLIAFSEEVLFRGLIQREISASNTWIQGIFVSSILYAIGVFGFGFLPVLFFFIAGAISAFMYERTGNLWLCIGFSLLLNAFIFVV